MLFFRIISSNQPNSLFTIKHNLISSAEFAQLFLSKQICESLVGNPNFIQRWQGIQTESNHGNTIRKTHFKKVDPQLCRKVKEAVSAHNVTHASLAPVSTQVRRNLEQSLNRKFRVFKNVCEKFLEQAGAATKNVNFEEPAPEGRYVQEINRISQVIAPDTVENH